MKMIKNTGGYNLHCHSLIYGFSNILRRLILNLNFIEKAEHRS